LQTLHEMMTIFNGWVAPCPNKLSITCCRCLKKL
jgi:hypothetical protein